MKVKQLKKWWRAAFIVGAISCQNDSLDPDGGAVASVVIAPARATVAVGATATLTAEALDAAGHPVPGRKVVWASADPAIATVSGAGVVTGVATGTVQVAASAEGKSAVAEVTVNPTPVASVRLTPASQDLMVGQTVSLVAQPMDVGGNPLDNRPVTFSSSNSAVASVNAAGVVTALTTGSTIITATSEGKNAVATITVSSIPVATVAVTPNENALVVGQTAQLESEPRDAAGQVLSGRQIVWTTNAPEVASVSSTGLVTAIAPGVATISASAEGKMGTALVTVSPKPVSSVIVSPSQSTVIVGQTTQLTAQVTDEQGNVLAGRPLAFSSSALATATVSASGLVTGVSPGTVTITATSEGKSGTATVVVLRVPVARVSIDPSQPNATVGETVQLRAEARGENGQLLVGREAKWQSGAPTIASVSPTGLVTAVAPGNAVIFANVEGVVGSTTVTVRAVQVGSVVVTPPTSSVVVGNAVQLSAAVRDAAGNPLDGRLVGWTSSDDDVAVVSSAGRVTGLKVGTATITASSEGKSGTATVTVTGAPVASVSVSPATLPLQVGGTGTLTATTRDAQNNVLTGRAVTWTSGTPGVATVSPDGTVTAVAPGTAVITAASEGKSGTATVTVTAIPVASVAVDPASASLTLGGTQQITATPRDAQGNALAGRAIAWQSGNTSIATVTQAGLVTAVGAGSTTVTATSEGKVGTVTVTVAAPEIGSVTVAPSSASVNVAFTTTLTATVRDANGAMVSVPVTWSTDEPSVASVTQTGVVTGMAPGTATITATAGGKSGTATITVALAPVATVTITPSQLNLRDRNNQRTGTLTATLRDANGNTLTGRTVTWTSSNTNVATVSATGVVTARDRGTVTITAASEGKTGTATVVVQN